MDIPEGHIKRIVLERMGRCRVCHRAYSDDDVRVVSRKPDMWMMVVECTDCHAKNFVAAVLNEGDPEQAELALRRLSDAASPHMEIVDTPQSSSTQVVTAADVADMHAFLGSFDGDFRAHFARR